MTIDPIPIPDLFRTELITEDSGRDTYPPTQASHSLLFDPIAMRVEFDDEFQPGRPVPAEIWYIRKLRFPLRHNVDESKLVETLRSSAGQSLLRHIADGFSIQSDNYNQVGTLTPDADAASNMLVDLLNAVPLLPYEHPGLWHAADWPMLSREALVEEIASDDSDEALSTLESRLISEARTQGAVLVALDAYLKYLRDEIRDAATERRGSAAEASL